MALLYRLILFLTGLLYFTVVTVLQQRTLSYFVYLIVILTNLNRYLYFLHVNLEKNEMTRNACNYVRYVSHTIE